MILENKDSQIYLSVVDLTKKDCYFEDSLLIKFNRQYMCDKREQLPEINRNFLFHVEDSVRVIHRNGKHLWFIMKDLTYIGYVTVLLQVYPVNRSVFISDFFIDKPYRGSGAGRISLELIIEKLFDHYPEAQRVGLSVFSDNHVAKNLYSNFGFQSKLETMVLEKDTFNSRIKSV